MAPPTIVLLHGFTQTGRSWAPTVAALGERYRALAPDLRGHGTAAAARPIEAPAIAADVGALVGAAPAGPPAGEAGRRAGAAPQAPARLALAGYSMGARLALWIALRDRALGARIERLVLIGGSPGLRDAEQRAARRAADEALAREIERDGVEPFARRWAALPLFAGQPPAVAARAHAERLRNTPAGLAASLRGVGTGALPSLWEELPALRVPVTLIAGERDAKFRAIAEQMGELIPHATVHVVPGAGHAVQLEQPAAVAALL